VACQFDDMWEFWVLKGVDMVVVASKMGVQRQQRVLGAARGFEHERMRRLIGRGDDLPLNLMPGFQNELHQNAPQQGYHIGKFTS
jgi:hypothetical protein